MRLDPVRKDHTCTVIMRTTFASGVSFCNTTQIKREITFAELIGVLSCLKLCAQSAGLLSPEVPQNDRISQPEGGHIESLRFSKEAAGVRSHHFCPFAVDLRLQRGRYECYSRASATITHPSHWAPFKRLEILSISALQTAEREGAVTEARFIISSFGFTQNSRINESV
jgi:hypothetical protein